MFCGCSAPWWLNSPNLFRRIKVGVVNLYLMTRAAEMCAWKTIVQTLFYKKKKKWNCKIFCDNFRYIWRKQNPGVRKMFRGFCWSLYIKCKQQGSQHCWHWELSCICRLPKPAGLVPLILCDFTLVSLVAVQEALGPAWRGQVARNQCWNQLRKLFGQRLDEKVLVVLRMQMRGWGWAEDLGRALSLLVVG